MTTDETAASVLVAAPERCNRPKSESRRRSQLVGVRMTDDERGRFQAFADRKGLKLPDLMRVAVEAALMEEAVDDARR